MIAFCSVVFGVCLLPLVSPQLTGAEKICQHSPFEKDVIESTVLGHINDERYTLLRGNQPNGPWTGKDIRLPKGKTMNTVKWSCKLETEARALLRNCTDIEPTAPADKTGLFYSIDFDEEPELTSAVFAWMEEIEEFAVSNHAITETAVKYADPALRQYLNLMRPSLSKMGCADVLCKKDGLYKYRAFCLTDLPPLKNNEIVYEVGKGGCDKNEKCPSGFACGEYGITNALNACQCERRPRHSVKDVLYPMYQVANAIRNYLMLTEARIKVRRRLRCAVDVEVITERMYTQF